MDQCGFIRRLWKTRRLHLCPCRLHSSFGLYFWMVAFFNSLSHRLVCLPYWVVAFFFLFSFLSLLVLILRLFVVFFVTGSLSVLKKKTKALNACNGMKKIHCEMKISIIQLFFCSFSQKKVNQKEGQIYLLACENIVKTCGLKYIIIQKNVFYFILLKMQIHIFNY